MVLLCTTVARGAHALRCVTIIVVGVMVGCTGDDSRTDSAKPEKPRLEIGMSHSVFEAELERCDWDGPAIYIPYMVARGAPHGYQAWYCHASAPWTGGGGVAVEFWERVPDDGGYVIGFRFVDSSPGGKDGLAAICDEWKGRVPVEHLNLTPIGPPIEMKEDRGRSIPEYPTFRDPSTEILRDSGEKRQ